MSPFTSVVRAEPEDTTEIMRLLVNTAEWLLSKGSTQWNGLLRGEDSHNTPEAINRGDVYIFKQDRRIAGMVMLLTEPSPWDRELWGEQGLDGTAVYLHRLAIDRKFAGQDVGKQIMTWAEDAVPTRLGKRLIRLDCQTGIRKLNDFYSGLGYSYVGESVNASGSFSKYEKKV